MLRIEQIRDAETLKQIAVLLERENDKLHAKVQALTDELTRLRGDDATAATRSAGRPGSTSSWRPASYGGSRRRC